MENLIIYKLFNIEKPEQDESLNLDSAKKIYRKAVLKYHPDKNTGASNEQKQINEEITKLLTAAWATLNDAEEEARYREQGLNGIERIFDIEQLLELEMILNPRQETPPPTPMEEQQPTITAHEKRTKRGKDQAFKINGKWTPIGEAISEHLPQLILYLNKLRNDKPKAFTAMINRNPQLKHFI